LKVLVTGSSGKLGKEIIDLFRNRNIESLGVDLTAADTTDKQVDIRDEQQLNKLFDGVSHVIHTAALHGKHTDLNVPREEFVNTNILGTLNLLNLSVQHNVDRFIYTSTTSIYGGAMVSEKQAIWVDELLIPEPRDIYDITKQAAEELCKDFHKIEGLKTTVLRVSRFMEESKNNIANYRLYRGLDEQDGAIAHFLAATNNFHEFEIFNISNKSPFQIDDLEQLKNNPKQVILKYYPDAEKIYESMNWVFPISIDRVYDISKAERKLGYTPRQNFWKLINSSQQTI
jgi:nucleoside-diphosphate-sugar epimerase